MFKWFLDWQDKRWLERHNCKEYLSMHKKGKKRNGNGTIFKCSQCGAKWEQVDSHYEDFWSMPPIYSYKQVK